MRCLLTVLMGILATSMGAVAQDASSGRNLVLCGGGALPDSVFKEFRRLAGPQAKLVVIPTASARKLDATAVRELWESRGFKDIRILHAEDREIALSKEFIQPLKAATAVWFGGGSQQRIADAYLGTPVEEELYRLLQRGGVVGGTSAGAAIQSKVMIASGRSQPQMSVGLDLLQRTIVDQHFLKRNRFGRLLAAVRAHPDRLGVGIDEGTALVVSRGESKAVGSSYVVRIESVQGQIRVDAFGDGESVQISEYQRGSVTLDRAEE